MPSGKQSSRIRLPLVQQIHLQAHRQRVRAALHVQVFRQRQDDVVVSIGVPIPIPNPIPWPRPSPGVGTPSPSPSPGTGTSTGTTTGGATGVDGGSSGGITGPFADLFKFLPDWALLGALLLLMLTVGLVDQMYPQYVWWYILILLLGLSVTTPTFGAELKNLLGR